MTTCVKDSKVQMVTTVGAFLIAFVNGESYKAIGIRNGISGERIRQRICKCIRIMSYLVDLNPKYKEAIGGEIGCVDAKDMRKNKDVYIKAVEMYPVFESDSNNTEYLLKRVLDKKQMYVDIAKNREDSIYRDFGWEPPSKEIRYFMLEPNWTLRYTLNRYLALRKTPPHVVIFNDRHEIAEEVVLCRLTEVVDAYLHARMKPNTVIFINGKLFKHGNITFKTASLWTDVFAAEYNNVAV